MIKCLLRSLPRSLGGFALLAALLAASLTANSPSLAAQTDISASPLASTTSAQVKPNIMLLMDTSGSMGWGHMPDEVESITGIGSVGYKSAQCNVLYYNPNQTYIVPKKSDGTPFSTPSFTAAPYAGFVYYYATSDSTDTSTVNLATSFQAFDRKTLRTATNAVRPPDANGNPQDGDNPQAGYYYVYSGSQTLGYATAPCTDRDTGVSKAATGGGTWTRVNVALSTPAQQSNFAIWYSYYRIRISLIKSAASLAFTPLTDTFRVGFITVQPKDSPSDTTINPLKYVPISDFNSSQRDTWYAKLFSQIPVGASPTREGLARVGRMYAGKHDSINGGMLDDPVQYSCQQNFTILTTDGYWNAQTESTSPAGLTNSGNVWYGGPLGIDGQTLVGQTDGTLDATTRSFVTSPRPIWDGTTDGTSVVENYTNAYSYGQCGSFASRSTTQFLRSTQQVTQSTSQNTQKTSQALQSTVQYLASKVQNLQSTVQNLVATSQVKQSTSRILASTVQNQQNTTQVTQSTLQILQSTSQKLQSTNQNLQSTSQTLTNTNQVTQTVAIVRQSTTQNLMTTSQSLQSTSQPTTSTVQQLASTSQILASTNQNRQSTAQTLQTTSQNLQSTNQNRQSTTQNVQSTSQMTRSTSQVNASMLQLLQSTSQITIATTQVQQTTSQTAACDSRTENCVYQSGRCTPSRYIRCETTVTGPTLVASCTPQSAGASNDYRQVTCTSSGTGPTGTSTCTPASASSDNSYTTTSCNTVVSGPTPVASCTPTTPSAGNNYTATACGSNSTGPTPVASCTPTNATSSNTYTATTCSTATTGPVGVASCSASTPTSGNAYTNTTCNPVTTSNVPVASCTASSASAANQYTSTFCPSPVVTTNVPVASCTSATASASNSYTTTTCNPVTTTNVPVASCLGSAATSSNSYTTTTCTTNNTTNVPVASCTSASPTSTNGYTTTTCLANNTTNAPTASCTAASPTAANNYTTVTCQPSVTATDVPSASCTAGPASAANSYTTTTCRTATTTDTPVPSCTAAAASSSNSYTATTCRTATTGPTVVSSCSNVAASSSNNYTATVCGANTTTNVPVASCSPSSASSGNNYTTTTCSTGGQANTPVASCTASGPTSNNGYLTTTCPTPVTTSNVAVASCTAATASAANSWTTTTCTNNVVSGPTVVASCTASGPTAANGYQSTTCGSIATSNGTATCTASSANPGNNYTTTTCVPVTTTAVPVASCTPSGPTPGNSYVTTTCPTPVTTSNVPVASCTATTASAPNWITTTCPTPVTTTNVPVASCTPVTASSSNQYTTTTCPTAVRTGPTGVASCTPVAASSGNAYIATTCGTNNPGNTAVATCTPSGPTAANFYTTTTCPSPNVTTDVAVASCTPAVASASNTYTTTTCRTDAPAATAVQSCTPTTPTSTNGYVTTTCSTVTTGIPNGIPTASCTVDPATAANNWTATSCPTPVTTSNVPVATCTPSPAVSGNNYTTTSCPSPIVTSNAPQASACVPSAASSSNNYVTTTCPSAPVTTTNVPVASCTVSGPTLANNYVATSCPTPIQTGPTGVASCTPVAASSANNYTATSCPATTVTGPTGVQACTPTAASAGNGWVTTTCANSDPTPTAAASCSPVSPTAANGYLTVSCSTATTGPTIVDLASCTPAAASASNSYTATTCVRAYGDKLQYTQTHSVSRQLYSGGVRVGNPVVTTDPAVGPTDVSGGSCFAPGTEPEPPVTPSPEPLPRPPSACTAWPCTTTLVNASGSTNSLADVAQYYYINDLRPAADWPATAGHDISTDNVQAVGTGPEDDRVPWQHMTTFTLGLGVSGTLNYRSDYPTATVGDFASIRTGVATTNSDGSLTATAWPLWPDPAVDYTNSDNWSNPKSIDDFWHTAVNGRGRYFSAGNPTSVVAGLSGALIGVQARLSGGAAAGVTTTQPTTNTDSRSFVGEYTTSDWVGDLLAYGIDLTTGQTLTTPAWSAQALLDTRTGAACDDRTIYLLHGGNTLVNFSWDGSVTQCSGNVVSSAGLDATEQANFTLANTQLLSQWANMTTAQQALTPGPNLVNFLRGQRGLENFMAGDVTKLYRGRKHVLGDIVDAQPVYVAAPTSSYTDAGYQAFQLAQANRAPTIYVAANDGMLHAFAAGTNLSDPQSGRELWAVVPSTVLPKMFRLADDNYRNIHQFSVDGTPVVADAHDASGWKTLLVAGLNDGGRGYYALDVTNPAVPRALWEFKAGSTCHNDSDVGYTSDCYLGYSFGKPVLTKLSSGNGSNSGVWVVLFASGYNNIGGGAQDGKGFLYVVNAITGAVIYRIPTGAGSATTPSGLAQINTYLELGASDNTVVNAYAGDLLGNVWRFNLSTSHDATLVGTAKDRSGTPQPISTRPELAELNGKPMVMIGTGRLLGASDIGDLQVQSLYGIVDQIPTTGSSCTASSVPSCDYSDLRGALKPLAMTPGSPTSGAARSIIDCTPATSAACMSQNGWVIDFPPEAQPGGSANVGERVNVDMKLALGTLVVGSNVPQSSACKTGGYSWLSNIDLATGLAVQDTAGNLEVSKVLSVDSLLVGFNVTVVGSPQEYRATGQLAGTQTTGGVSSFSQHIRVVQPAPPGKRISWREIVQ